MHENTLSNSACILKDKYIDCPYYGLLAELLSIDQARMPQDMYR